MNLLGHKNISLINNKKIIKNTTKCRNHIDYDQKVFAIKHKHNKTLWGWHMDNFMTDGAFKSQVLVFQRKNDAELLASRLWIHKLKSHKWPNTILEYKPFLLATEDNIQYDYPSVLRIEEVNLVSLIYNLSQSCAGVKLITQQNLDNNDISLNGQYMQIRVSRDEKIKLLMKIWNYPCKKYL